MSLKKSMSNRKSNQLSCWQPSAANTHWLVAITFPALVIVENIIPRNMIINLGCASVDNHIPRDDIFDYHPRRECNIYKVASHSLLLSLFKLWRPKCHMF